jgi:hypothetical protein
MYVVAVEERAPVIEHVRYVELLANLLRARPVGGGHRDHAHAGNTSQRVDVRRAHEAGPNDGGVNWWHGVD